MQESQEVREAVELFYERLSAGDVEGTAGTISVDEGSFVIGTQNIGTGRSAWLDSVQETATYGIAFEGGAIRGFAEGEMGWAVDEPTIVLPDGARLTTRMTAVLRRGTTAYCVSCISTTPGRCPTRSGCRASTPGGSNSVSAPPPDRSRGG